RLPTRRPPRGRGKAACRRPLRRRSPPRRRPSPSAETPPSCARCAGVRTRRLPDLAAPVLHAATRCHDRTQAPAAGVPLLASGKEADRSAKLLPKANDQEHVCSMAGKLQDWLQNFRPSDAVVSDIGEI
ncbi:unnamed protein product, partial [Urochloa humidicola]